MIRFYDELYIAGFPDPDERESLANMQRYLSLKREGWYGRNNYHIALLMDDNRILAASVSDYLVEANFGVIEFILVDEAVRGRRLGRTIHDETLDLLQGDARRAGNHGLDANIIELNDPFRVSPQRDNFDPVARALAWNGWGYGRLRFRYIQPALSPGQKPVDCLILAAKPFVSALMRALPADRLLKFLECYLIWAMRIPDPRANATFRTMARGLSRTDQVAIEPLASYVGHEADRHLDIREASMPGDEAFRSAVTVYDRAFPPGPSSVAPATFAQSLTRVRGRKRLHYHFWALASEPDAPAHGMAAFFVMPRFGFGGYIALEPPLTGRGLSRVLLKRIEEQMIRDEPGVREWYIECDPGSAQEKIFEHLGFVRVPVAYCQPTLVASGDARATVLGPELVLMRKGLGEEFDPWTFSPRRLRPVLRQILSDVYLISDPANSVSFRKAAGAIE